MEATRALVTIRLTSGVLIYVNEAQLAQNYLERVVDAGQVGHGNETIEVPADVADRARTVSASLDVHKQLNALVGQPCHGLGDAYRKAKHMLPQKLSREIRQFKRDRDSATQAWSSSGCGLGAVSIKNTFLHVASSNVSTDGDGGSFSAPEALETCAISEPTTPLDAEDAVQSGSHTAVRQQLEFLPGVREGCAQLNCATSQRDCAPCNDHQGGCD